MKQQKLKDIRIKMYAEATEYMRSNPNKTFTEVGDRYGISFMTASSLWRKAGFPARKDGRKTGISPAKSNKGEK